MLVYALQALVILMVLAILLVSAAAVTKLMAINISSSRNIVWSQSDMVSRIDAAMLVSTSLDHLSHGVQKAAAFAMQVGPVASWQAAIVACDACQ